MEDGIGKGLLDVIEVIMKKYGEEDKMTQRFVFLESKSTESMIFLLWKWVQMVNIQLVMQQRDIEDVLV